MYIYKFPRLITFNQRSITQAQTKSKSPVFYTKALNKAKCQNQLFFLSQIGMLVRSSI